MTLHAPKKEPWQKPVMRASAPKPKRATTGFSFGALLGSGLRDEVRAREQAERDRIAAAQRRRELDDMGFRPLTGA